MTALPSALETLAALRENGIKVCLTSGFAPTTSDALLARLDWKPRWTSRSPPLTLAAAGLGRA